MVTTCVAWTLAGCARTWHTSSRSLSCALAQPLERSLCRPRAWRVASDRRVLRRLFSGSFGLTVRENVNYAVTARGDTPFVYTVAWNGACGKLAVCGFCAAQVDLLEANTHAIHATAHTPKDGG